MSKLYNWSFSRLMVYEKCPLQLKLKAIDRLPEPPRDAKHPAERGSRIHDSLELSLKAGVPVPSEAKAFQPILDHAHQLFLAGQAHGEDDWWFDDAWRPIPTKDGIWLWMKTDLTIEDRDNDHVITVDYKTGKSAYKMPEHVQQGQLYTGCSALRYPDVNRFTVELHYIDEGWVKTMTYSREQALKFIGLFDRRVRRMYDEKLWRGRPNVITCKYCPYSPRGTGACPVGV